MAAKAGIKPEVSIPHCASAFVYVLEGSIVMQSEFPSAPSIFYL
jgi:hypothetical protein